MSCPVDCIYYTTLVYICFATDPPSKLSITGYEEGTTIDAGTVLRLLCTATSGNPLATLSWYKNDRKVNIILDHYLYIIVFTNND